MIESDETVLGGVVSGPVEDVDAPVFEDAELLGQQDCHEPSGLGEKYWGAMCQK
jgi:hypothetical protein